jgi:SRSO17 transposase
MVGWEERFGAYVELLGAVLGHADRGQPLKAYTTGRLLPGARKSVEPPRPSPTAAAAPRD